MIKAIVWIVWIGFLSWLFGTIWWEGHRGLQDHYNYPLVIEIFFEGIGTASLLVAWLVLAMAPAVTWGQMSSKRRRI